jgi:uncharacterized protein YjiS (DUF1127 family)
MFAEAARSGADVRTGIGSVLRMVSRWIDRSDQRNMLAGMDDHLLRDIGVSDDDSPREASKPFWKTCHVAGVVEAQRMRGRKE